MSSALALSRQHKDKCSDKVNYRGTQS